jgi:hypothetical protein
LAGTNTAAAPMNQAGARLAAMMMFENLSSFPQILKGRSFLRCWQGNIPVS